MGHMFAASAFRGVPPTTLATAIAAYLKKHDVSCAEFRAEPVNEKRDALLYAPENGWTVITWPNYLSIHDVQLCAAVSRETGAVAMTVNVYDGDFWSYEVFEAGTLVDKFAPRADYFADDENPEEELRTRWRGDPEAVASSLGIPVDVVRPYYRYVGPDDDSGKAFDDDESTLDNFWVFTDFWRRIGIAYRAHPDEFAVLLRLGNGFGDKLPSGEGEPLE